MNAQSYISYGLLEKELEPENKALLCVINYKVCIIYVINKLLPESKGILDEELCNSRCKKWYQSVPQINVIKCCHKC